MNNNSYVIDKTNDVVLEKETWGMMKDREVILPKESYIIAADRPKMKFMNVKGNKTKAYFMFSSIFKSVEDKVIVDKNVNHLVKLAGMSGLIKSGKGVRIIWISLEPLKTLSRMIQSIVLLIQI